MTPDPPRAKRLLLSLAKRLREVHKRPEPIGFDYTQWYSTDPDCGTVACAAGHAALMPEFQALGLAIVDDVVECHGAFAGRAMAIVLGITTDHSEYLFCPAECAPLGLTLPRSPKHDASALDVAQHIERYVAARWPEATA